MSVARLTMWADADLLAEHADWQWWQTQFLAGALEGEAIGAYIAAQLAEIEAEIERRRRFGLSRKPGLIGGHFPRAFLDELRLRCDLVAIVEGHGVRLRKSGQTWRGKCPWHNGKSDGSLAVWRDEGRWRCFGCGLAGDAISWNQMAGRLDFVQAVEGLAAILNVPVPAAPRIDTRRTG